ncbi:MAG: hypothetical protein JW882_08555 [Deltaproteobacteria bacterium]|nr:hypothetical protein [Deltaproteobacteria bacterium]
MNGEGDIVLIHYHDQPTMYARIERIEPDVKKDWYRVTILILSIPPQEVTWILREEYINGSPFTMGGNPMVLKEVKKFIPSGGGVKTEKESRGKGTGNKAKVIPLKSNSD